MNIIPGRSFHCMSGNISMLTAQVLFIRKWVAVLIVPDNVCFDKEACLITSNRICLAASGTWITCFMIVVELDRCKSVSVRR